MFTKTRRNAFRLLALAAIANACGLDIASDESELEVAKTGYTAKVTRGLLAITGNGDASKLVLRLRAATPTTLDVDVGDNGTADFSFDRSKFDRILIDAKGGDDIIRMDETLGAFTHEEMITVLAGAGNDTITGGIGAETLNGGAGNDVISPGRGTDVVFMGDGDDTMAWNPGDQSDVVEGDAGKDLLIFNGANIGENFELAAQGSRLRVSRDIASVNMDLDGIERVELGVRGGIDVVAVHDLTTTAAELVTVDLAMPGTTGDGVADIVTFEGTPGADAIDVTAEGTAVIAKSPAVSVRVINGEPALDRVAVTSAVINANGTAGNDTILAFESAGHGMVQIGDGSVLLDASGMSKLALNGLGGEDTLRLQNGQGQLPVVLDGGEGNDLLFGGNFGDKLLGGPGNDVVQGGQGADNIFLGDGDDTFVWNPGDASDVIEGEAGTDNVLFNGANVSEQIAIFDNGGRLGLTRDIAAITLDAGGMERVDLNVRGGADTVRVFDLAATSVARVNVDVASTPGGAGDAAADVVSFEGTPRADLVEVMAEGAAVIARMAGGPGAVLSVTGGEPGLDRIAVNGLGGDAVDVNGADGPDTMQVFESTGHALVSVEGWTVMADAVAMGRLAVNGLGGDDVIVAFSSATLLPLQLDGGEGNDTIRGANFPEVIFGGPGNDFIDGGLGADTVHMGEGDDTFNWDPGDGSDLVEGEDGADALVFNGSNIGEEIAVTAIGGRGHVTRNIGTINMDLDGVERFDFNVTGGADKVTVDDLTGTAVTDVNLDLGQLGTGQTDLADDVVIVRGSQSPDVITAATEFGFISVSGLAATTRIVRPDLSDTLMIQGLGGLDTITDAVGGSMMVVIQQD